MKIGQKLQFTKTVCGSSTIVAGTLAIYQGDSKIKILDGECRDMVFALLISAPVIEIN